MNFFYNPEYHLLKESIIVIRKRLALWDIAKLVCSPLKILSTTYKVETLWIL